MRRKEKMIARKKRLLIIISSIVGAILIIVGGILGYLYFATDLLRSNDELFYKYAMQNSKILEVIDKNWLDTYTQKIENTPYINEGEIVFLQQEMLQEENELQNEEEQVTEGQSVEEQENGSETNQVQDIEQSVENNTQNEANSLLNTLINNTKIEISGKNDLKNQKVNQTIRVLYKEQNSQNIENPNMEQNQEAQENQGTNQTAEQTEQEDNQTEGQVQEEENDYTEKFNVSMIRTNNTYGLKSDEVVNKYVAVKNENLKELMNKLGENNLENIDNAIEKVDYNSILAMSEEKKEQLKQRYMTIFDTQISKKRYQKEKKVETQVFDQNILTNTYQLELTQTEFANLKVKLLEALKEDEDTLQLIKDITQKDENYITKMKEEIQDSIDEIKRQKTTDEVEVKFVVYENNMNLVKTEIIFSNRKITIEYPIQSGVQQVKINDETTGEGTIIEQYLLSKVSEEANHSLTIEYSVTENGREATKIDINLISEGSINDSSMKSTIDIDSVIENVQRKITYTDNKEFTNEISLEELNSDNCVILNDATIEYNRSLMEAIKQRLQVVFREKITSIGMNADELLKEIEEATQFVKDQFNRDEFEKQVQRALSFVKQDVITDEELRKELQEAGTDQTKIEEVKGKRLVKRLNEFGLKASLDPATNKVLIDSGYNYNYKYTIDYNKYYIKRQE